MNIKTLDINAKEWFDKLNGNSYFSGSVSINFGMKSEKIIKMPFQYGYGEQYISVANDCLNQCGYIKNNEALWRYCLENNIILRTSKKENCLKRELMNI